MPVQLHRTVTKGLFDVSEHLRSGDTDAARTRSDEVREWVRRAGVAVTEAERSEIERCLLEAGHAIDMISELQLLETNARFGDVAALALNEARILTLLPKVGAAIPRTLRDEILPKIEKWKSVVHRVEKAISNRCGGKSDRGNAFRGVQRVHRAFGSKPQFPEAREARMLDGHVLDRVSAMIPSQVAGAIDSQLQQWPVYFDAFRLLLERASGGDVRISQAALVGDMRSLSEIKTKNAIVAPEQYSPQAFRHQVLVQEPIKLRKTLELNFLSRYPFFDRSYGIGLVSRLVGQDQKVGAPLIFVDSNIYESALRLEPQILTALEKVFCHPGHDLLHTLFDRIWSTRAWLELERTYDNRRPHVAIGFLANIYEETLMSLMKHTFDVACAIDPDLKPTLIEDAERYVSCVDSYFAKRVHCLAAAVKSVEHVEQRARAFADGIAEIDKDVNYLLCLYFNAALMFILDPGPVPDSPSPPASPAPPASKRRWSWRRTRDDSDVVARLLLQHPHFRAHPKRAASISRRLDLLPLQGIDAPTPPERVKGSLDQRFARIFHAHPFLFEGSTLQRTVHDDAKFSRKDGAGSATALELGLCLFGASRHFDADPDLVWGRRLAGLSLLQGFELLKASAEREEETEAQYSLGMIYARGVRVPRDERLAIHWLGRAADASHERAVRALKFLKKGRPVPADRSP